MYYRMISADNHFNEPGDVYTKRVPAAMKDRAPKLVPTPDGGEAWLWDGDVPQKAIDSFQTIVFVKGKWHKPEDFKRFPIKHSDTAEGSYIPKRAIEEMEKDGVDASVWYPGLATNMYATKDKDLRLALVRAYNDWQAEWCSYDNDRLLGLAIIPTEEETTKEAIEELYRAVKLGFKGVLVPMIPAKRFYEKWWDPFWAAAQEADMPVHFHKGVGPKLDTGIYGDRKGPGNYGSGQIASDFMYSFPIGDLVFSGVFDRFPKLKIVSGEGRIGWLLHFIDRGDASYRRHRFHSGMKLDMMPSDYVRRNIYSTFLEDRSAILLRDRIGVDNQMWSSDYPHSDTVWPYSKQLNDEQFEGIPEIDKRKMVALNAAKLYKLPADEFKKQ